MNRHEDLAPEVSVVNGDNVVHDERTGRYLLQERPLWRRMLTSQATRAGAIALTTFAACNVVTYEALALGGTHSWETPLHDLQNFSHGVGKVASALVSIGEHL
jgi:hypothetical protein